MSQLQKLLDERFPQSGFEDNYVRSNAEEARKYFTEGYNAAMKEASGVLMGIVKLEKMADESIGFVDNPHTKSLRKAASNAREFLLTINSKVNG